MKFFQKIFPAIFIFFTIFFFYYPFFCQNKLPIPSDIITGVYFPWLDLKFDNYPTGIPVKNALPSDVVSLTYPLRLLSINLIKNNQWPLWNPFILSGTPLLANFQSAALYPLNFLFLIIKNFSLAWSYQVILQYFLAYFFMYLFLKSHKFSTTSSIFGAFTWAFSSFFSIWGEYNTVIHSIIYLPLALYSVRKIKQNPVWGFFLTLSFTFSMYAGNPPISLILIAFTAFYSLFEYKKEIKYYLICLIFALLSLGLSSPLLLPGNDVLNNSIRNVDSVAQQANIKYLPLFKILSLIAPDFFGNPSTLNTWADVPLYDNTTLYAGIIPLIFFLFTLTIKKKTPALKFFLTASAISLFLMIKNPITSFIFNLPIFGLSAMVATRLSVLLNFCISFCAAFTFDYLLKNKIYLKNYFKIFIAILGLIFLALISIGFVYLWTKYFPDFFRNHILNDLTINNRIFKQFNVSIRNSVLPLFLIFFSFFIFILKNKLSKNIFIFSIFLITFFDLYRFFNKYNSFTPSTFLYPQNDITSYLQQNSIRFARENAEIIPSNMWMPYNLYSASGFDTLHSLPYNQFLSLVNGGSLKSTTSRFAEINRYDSPLINFLGITHFIAVKRKDAVPNNQGEVAYFFNTKTYPVAYQSGRTAILKNNNALPLIYPVNQYQISNNIEDTEKLLLSSDLSKTVILNNDDPKINLNQSFPQLKNIEIKPQQTSLDIDSEGNSLLVTSQNFDNGWKLYIDNKPSTIIRANHSFMAFFVPDGSHQILLVYQPSAFFNGLKICLVSSILLITYTFLLLLKNKKNKL